MTHVPMMTDFVAETLTLGGSIVHESANGQITMRLVGESGDTILDRVFAESHYLIETGIARTVSETYRDEGVEYRRVIQ